MEVTEFFAGKTVVVTGGGGSIGSKLCVRLAPLVRQLRIVSLNELSLYNIAGELAKYGHTNIVPVLGSVCADSVMERAAQGADVVIHAAAYKHVPLCEQNPLQAIINNVGGTLTAWRHAAQAGAQFVQVSTDKACNPRSVMGATKRMAELFLLRRSKLVTTSIVRFGNVMGSAGSVLPLWRKQLDEGGPLTLTDRRCTRYMMTVGEACHFVLSVAALRTPGLFVYDMGQPKNMGECAERMIEQNYLHTGRKVDILETGLRPGEKLHEEIQSTSARLLSTGVHKVKQAIEPESTGDSLIHELLAAAHSGNELAAVSILREAVQWN